MAEREHFTNGRTWTFGTGFGLISLSFGAQIGGWAHWIAVGAGYGGGIVLMLLSAVLITKSYLPGQSEHLALPPPPSPTALALVDDQPPAVKPPSKLKIILATTV